ncbi:hypothetical protein [Psychromonas sp. SP041]|uniref:hypothetical protein n=1 Tax=Psychromonas sp. SP041 TaxID=1365007 RepID=UPI0003FAA6B3|nr:hypothetical protein [Psychromonas sp. SP041]
MSKEKMQENVELKPVESDAKKGLKKTKPFFSFMRKKSENKPILLPDNLLLGFQRGVSKQDLLVYLRSKSMEIGDPELAKVQIIKKDGGFYWEIHDSGSGHGVLQDVLLNLETKPLVNIQTSRKIVQVVLGKNDEGLSSALLTERSQEAATPEIKYKDKMFSINSKGTGLFVFSIVFASLGVLSLFLSVLFKYGILNQENKSSAYVQTRVPYEKISELKEILLNEQLVASGTYAKKIALSSDKTSFLISTGKESPVEVSSGVEGQDEVAALAKELGINEKEVGIK